jgi:serine/threonine protein kinase
LHCIDAVARSNHRNVVQVQDRWLENYPAQKVFIQTELLDGDLNQYIEFHRNAGRTIGYRDVWKITLDIVDALTYAHELGWSHRNLKPTNGIHHHSKHLLIAVLAKKIGSNFGLPMFTWKVCDWGLAPALIPPPSVDEPVTYIPTSDDAYRAPEHRHSPSAAVDIWSVGCILFELATNGVIAFPVSPEDPTYIVENGKTPAKLATAKTPQVVSDPEGRINHVLNWCLNPNPALRPTARQLGIYIRGIAQRS